MIVVYEQWQVTGIWQRGWKITEDDSGQYCHSYLQSLQSMPTGNSLGYPKIAKHPLLSWTADQSACYQPLVNCGKNVFDQMQCFFTVNKLTDFQHAYREGHSTCTSTCTALTQMTDCLRKMYNKKIVGAIVFDFSVDFGIIDHNLLLEKCMCYGFTSPAILWIESYRGYSLMEDSPT